MATTVSKNEKRDRRRKKIRAKISGTLAVPRLSIFKSNRYVYVQLIDDAKGQTLASYSSMGIPKGKVKGMKGLAKETGIKIAELAKAKKIEKVVFDRGGYRYAGAVKILADGAREGGLIF